MNCTCFTRTFWEGPCEWCVAHPQEQPPLDYQQISRAVLIEVQLFFDEVIEQAAEELGWKAGESIKDVLI